MIYEKIKRLAAKEGISIASLEKKLNIGNGTIRKWNEASPTFENVLKVAKYFDVTAISQKANGGQRRPSGTLHQIS